MSTTNGERRLRLGIVGCGAVVRECHLPAILRSRGVAVRALCDLDARSAASLGRQFELDAHIADRLGDLADRVDAAIVAVPPRAHAPVAIELIERGVDVLCEKPIATTSAAARAMIAAAARSRRVLAVGFWSRHLPSNRVLRAILEGGLLGRVREVAAEEGAAMAWEMRTDSYFNPAATAGGVLLDSHLVDRLSWLFGPPRIDAYEDDSYGGFEANARLVGAITIGGDEVPCRIEVSWTHALENSIRVIGSDAVAEVDLGSSDAVTIRRTIDGRPFALRVEEEGRCDDAGRADYFQVQIEDFAHAVETRGKPLGDAESALRSLEVIEAAYARRRRMAQPWVEAGGPAA